MKIELKIDEVAYDCILPYVGAEYVQVPDQVCPNCGELLHICGGEITTGHDTYTAQARCTICEYPVGLLVVTVSTIFGIEEDEAVMNGRCRVY